LAITASPQPWSGRRIEQTAQPSADRAAHFLRHVRRPEMRPPKARVMNVVDEKLA